VVGRDDGFSVEFAEQLIDLFQDDIE
jgi:hypothetical protein